MNFGLVPAYFSSFAELELVSEFSSTFAGIMAFLENTFSLINAPVLARTALIASEKYLVRYTFFFREFTSTFLHSIQSWNSYLCLCFVRVCVKTP